MPIVDLVMATIKDLLGDWKPESEDQGPVSNKQWRVGYDGNVYVVKVRTEKRRGKVVTIAWNFQAHPKDLHDLLAQCKKSFGTGGQVVDNSIELQGDHVEKLKVLLTEMRYKVGK